MFQVDTCQTYNDNMRLAKLVSFQKRWSDLFLIKKSIIFRNYFLSSCGMHIYLIWYSWKDLDFPTLPNLRVFAIGAGEITFEKASLFKKESYNIFGKKIIAIKYNAFVSEKIARFLNMLGIGAYIPMFRNQMLSLEQRE